jgi:hypothetical protein
MSIPVEGVSSPSESPAVEYHEIVVKRDGNRPVAFAGQTLAKISQNSGIIGWSISAALYKTRGGKFVSALSKTNTYTALVEGVKDPETAHSGEFNKAQVFDSFDDAVAWFRPGRLTDALRKQLGLDEPERIE